MEPNSNGKIYLKWNEEESKCRILCMKTRNSRYYDHKELKT